MTHENELWSLLCMLLLIFLVAYGAAGGFGR